MKLHPENENPRAIPYPELDSSELPIKPLLLEGIAQLESDRLDDALVTFTAAAQKLPESFSAWYLQGRTALLLEWFKKADESFRHARELRPENIEVRYLLAYSHFLQDMVEEAAGEFLEIIDQNPDFLDVYYDCGVALQILGRYDDAIDIFRRRLDISTDFDCAIMCAMTYEMISDYENTEKMYHLAMDLEPQNIMVIESHGATCIELERYDDALADFNLALSLDPQSPDAYYGRGRTFFCLGNIEKALEDLPEAVRLDGNNVLAWSMLGQVKLFQENYFEALDCFDRALEISPDLLIYDFRACARRGVGDYDGALEDINLAMEFEPDNEEFHLDKASILYDTLKFDEAFREVNSVLKHSHSAEAHRLRALIHMERLEYKLALSDFNSALKNGLETEEIYLRRGELLYQLGRSIDAINDFFQAKTLAEESGNAEEAARCEELIQNMLDDET